jgi:TonB family protein
MGASGTTRSFATCCIILLISAPLGLASTSQTTVSHFHAAQGSIAAFHHFEMDRSATAHCESSEPATALATPDPLLGSHDPQTKVAVSFIIGIDGRVHSPVILESAGPAEDDRVLQALRIWRYRPATCNTAPTEMESKVEFSSR